MVVLELGQLPSKRVLMVHFVALEKSQAPFSKRWCPSHSDGAGSAVCSSLPGRDVTYPFYIYILLLDFLAPRTQKPYIPG